MKLVARLVVALLALSLVSPVVPTSAAPLATQFRIQALSARPDMVTGGDVLLGIRVPLTSPPSPLTVTVGGRDVTAKFRRTGTSFVGLVDGLAVGSNTIVARLGPGRPTTSLTVENHPISGPVLSGPHQEPFVCETASFRVPIAGTALGAPTDADCSAPTRVDYVYRTTSGAYKPLPNPGVRPADLARTTTNQGRTVNFIVRIETGTINRAIYEVATLHDPVTDPAPGPLAKSAGWNERLIVNYAGGCRAGYHQGGGIEMFPFGPLAAMPSPVNSAWLSQGYAVAVSSLTTFNNNCNDVLSAETTMMVKERFTERYGVPRHTIGSGDSGGSMQQQLIAQNYPGLLDGIMPSLSFPDALVLLTSTSDCPLLVRGFDASWTAEQKAAVTGWGSAEHCTDPFSGDWGRAFLATAGTEPTYAGCSSIVPRGLVYHPTSNPDGARCTYQDNAVNVFGRDPVTGFAPRPLDNVGVQYGLDAFNAGTISADQFLDLNERAGGYDLDGNLVPTRTVGTADAIATAYRTGRVNSGANLDTIPIIDFRYYVDDTPDPHDSVRSHTMRARLVAANGSAANHVILTTSLTATGAGSTEAVAAEALRLMDRWLTAIDADLSTTPPADKVRNHKPAAAVDACYTANGTRVTDQAQCRRLYPPHENARMAAGEPLANDVLKCALQPVRESDYDQPLTEEQLRRLETIFPTGVCDYSRPGVGQQAPEGTWARY